MKKDFRVAVAGRDELPGGYRRMAFDAPELARALQPGQFIQIRVDPDGEAPLLRRPFTPSWFEPDTGRVEIVFAVVGVGTRALARRESGAILDVLGPLGRGYEPPPPGAPAVIVGGGCGAPGLRPWLRALRASGHRTGAVVGARTALSLPELDRWGDGGAEPLLTASDDGSTGFRGNAVAAAESLLDGPFRGVKPALYGCGPRPMLSGLARMAAARGLACQVSLEERMACGFGACMGCSAATRNPADPDPAAMVYERVCRDGPVFDAARLVW